MIIEVVTLFPDLFAGPLSVGLVGKAIASGIAKVECVDPRKFATDVHHSVDDAPYGGGGGMVMKAEPLHQAVEEARAKAPGPVVLMSPQGRPLAQRDLERWSSGSGLTLVCGRYEGFDERIRRRMDDEVSLGDFVLTGGEYAALTIVDGVIRLLPGTLGNANSSVTDSFTHGLLEHPHYTRPETWDGEEVPTVLRSGDHGRVAEWRHAQSLQRTLMRRPDLFVRRGATAAERVLLTTLSVDRSVSLVVGPRSAAELMALVRLAAAYRIGSILVNGPIPDLGSVEVPLPETPAAEKKRLKKRRPAPVTTLDAAEICRPYAPGPQLIAVGGDPALPVEPYPKLPYALVLGEAGVEPQARLPRFRVASPAADFPLVAAAAVALDRLIGEG